MSIAVTKRKRIDWIDIAKGIGIILVVIGHTAKLGSVVRNVIFSFHMPLFFILSGFTFRRAETWQELHKKTFKDFKTLILPMLIVLVLCIILRFLSIREHDYYNLLEITKDTIKSLVYCSGVSIRGLPALGALWFIVSMFSARLIINSLHVLIKNDKNELVLLILGLVGILLGVNGYRLLFNFDVTLAAVFFLTIGIIAKKNYTYIKKYLLFFLIVSVFIFMEAILSSVHLEMATRSYSTFSILASIAGTLIVCEFCNIISNFHNLKQIFTFIGMNSIIVFFVHYLDFSCRFLWIDSPIYLQFIIRPAACLILALSYVWIKNEFKRIHESINT